MEAQQRLATESSPPEKLAIVRARLYYLHLLTPPPEYSKVCLTEWTLSGESPGMVMKDYEYGKLLVLKSLEAVVRVDNSPIECEEENWAVFPKHYAAGLIT